jgi:hypothetical protein
VRDNEELLGLNSQADFIRFIEEDFIFYSKWYEIIRKASHKLTEGMEYIFYNAQVGFTHQSGSLGSHKQKRHRRYHLEKINGSSDIS